MEQFTLRVSWRMAIESLAPAECGRLLVALMKYAETQEPQNLCGREKKVFDTIAKEIDEERLCKNAQDLCKIAHIEKDINSLIAQPSEEGTENCSVLTSENMFEIFWNTYNQKVNRKRCVELWKRINPDERLFRQMMKAIADWEQSDRWKRGYKPDPDTWLRNERWNDEVPPTPQRSGRYNRATQGYAQHPIGDISHMIVDLGGGS